jgi:hypothetical protein
LFNGLIIFGIILYEVGGWPIPLPRDVNWDFVLVMANVAITGLMLFCVAWFFSSFVGSPTLAVCAGLIAPFLVASGIALTDLLLKWSGLQELSGLEMALWYLFICLTIALACFGVGTWHYLRRVEP